MTDRHTTNTTPATPLPTGGPICTLAAARAAGLDIPPAPAELAAMAETVVAAAQDAPTAEVDLARAVPLMLEALAAAQRERDEALARVAELEQQAAEQRGELDTARAEITVYEEQRDALFRLGRLMRNGQRWDGDRLVSERRLGLPEIRAALGWDEPRPDRPLLTEDAARPTA